MSERCGAVHPEDSSRVCILKGTGHGDHVDANRKPWTDHQRVEQVKANTQSRRSKKRSATMRSIVKKARKGKEDNLKADEEQEEKPPLWGPGPIVRADDPETSQIAAERYEPKRDTAKGRVLAYLRERVGQWVDAPDLTTEEVGGFAGTRRLRELREQGWPIETRLKPGSENTWQHRLVSESPS